LAYVHDPLFSARRDANSLKVTHIYKVLYAAGADVMLSGDYHNYQRFEPQDPDGNADYERGIRQFVVGTGGKNHYAIGSPIENLKVYNDNTYGVLKLSLKEGGYEWRFVPVEGETFTDSGSARCNPLAPIERTHFTTNTQ
jgi:acid phosphatase type 7